MIGEIRIKFVEFTYPTSGGLPIGEHMREGRDDVDGEADKKGPDGGIDRAEEREDDGQEPNRDHDREPSECPKANALCVVHPYYLLPHEVERCARESECDELRKSKQTIRAP